MRTAPGIATGKLLPFVAGVLCRRHAKWLVVICPALASVNTPALAGTAPVDTLTGDWNGKRTALAQRGLSVTAMEITETAWDAVSDGPHQVRTVGQFTLTATLDTERMFDWPRGKMQMALSRRHGTDLGLATDPGLLQLPQASHGRGDVWRLAQLWYEQGFAQGSLKLGRMSSAEDFASAPCEFQNLTLCGSAPGHIAPDTIYNYPIGQWGARLRWEFSPAFSLALGIYESNADNLGLAHGFSLGFHPGDGYLKMAEFAWTSRFRDGTTKGTYRIGGWYDNGDATDVAIDAQGGYRALSGLPGETRNGRSGGFLNVLHWLRAPSGTDSGTRLLINGAIADRGSNTLRDKLAVEVIGPSPVRPTDSIGIGLGTSSVNPHITDSQRAARVAGLRSEPAATREYVFEVFYGIRPTWARWLELRPNLGVVHHPGGRSDRPTAAIVGLKIFYAL